LRFGSARLVVPQPSVSSFPSGAGRTTPQDAEAIANSGFLRAGRSR